MHPSASILGPTKAPLPRLILRGFDQTVEESAATRKKARGSSDSSSAMRDDAGDLSDSSSEGADLITKADAASSCWGARRSFPPPSTSLVLLPSSLSALLRLAREEFDWDAPAAGDDESAAADVVRVYLQEGVCNGSRGGHGHGHAASAAACCSAADGSASWGGAIRSEASFALLRDGDVVECVRSKVHKSKQPAKTPLQTAAQNGHASGAPPAAPSSAVAAAVPTRKRSHAEADGSGSSPRAAAAASAPVPPSSATAASASSSAGAALSPSVAAAAVPSPAAASAAASGKAPSAAAAAEQSPDMPPLEDALGQPVQRESNDTPVETKPTVQQQQPQKPQSPQQPPSALLSDVNAVHQQQLLVAQHQLQQQQLQQQQLHQMSQAAQMQIAAQLYQAQMMQQAAQAQAHAQAQAQAQAAAIAAQALAVQQAAARNAALLLAQQNAAAAAAQAATPPAIAAPPSPAAALVAAPGAVPASPAAPSAAVPTPTPVAAPIAPAAAPPAAAPGPGQLTLHFRLSSEWSDPVASIQRVKIAKPFTKSFGVFCKYKQVQMEAHDFYARESNDSISGEAAGNTAQQEYTRLIDHNATPQSIGWTQGEHAIMVKKKNA